MDSSGAPARRLQQRAAGPRPGLTILAYHRIGAPDPNGSADPSLYSATAEGFAWQLDFMQRHFSLLSFEEIVQRSRSGKSLPANAAVITFDDGYRDNYDLAYPLLRARGLSATIYLVTGLIGTTQRMWWDEAAALLAAAPAGEKTLPLLGQTRLKTGSDRARAVRKLRAALKALPHERRARALEELRRSVGSPQNRPADREYMNWDEVSEMRRGGIVFGAHTHTHPILTQVPLQTAEVEILRSQQAIDQVISQPCRLFAYPNGGRGQFNAQTRAVLAAHRFDAAVTLVRGSNQPGQPGFDWLELRRVYIGGGDDRAVFAVKVSGLLDGAVFPASAPAYGAAKGGAQK